MSPLIESILTKLLAHEEGGGFATTLAPGDLDALAVAFESLGVIVRRTSHKECYKDGIMYEWETVLGFPAYQGHNIDAFEESLCDREITPREATALLVEDGFRLLRSDVMNLPRMLELLGQGRKSSGYKHPYMHFPPLWVVLNFEDANQIDRTLKNYPGIHRLTS